MDESNFCLPLSIFGVTLPFKLLHGWIKPIYLKAINVRRLYPNYLCKAIQRSREQIIFFRIKFQPLDWREINKYILLFWKLKCERDFFGILKLWEIALCVQLGWWYIAILARQRWNTDVYWVCGTEVQDGKMGRNNISFSYPSFWPNYRLRFYT